MTQISTIICFMKINHLPRQLSFAVSVNMLKRELFAQTNLVYNRFSLARNLH